MHKQHVVGPDAWDSWRLLPLDKMLLFLKLSILVGSQSLVVSSLPVFARFCRVCLTLNSVRVKNRLFYNYVLSCQAFDFEWGGKVTLLW